MNITHTNSALSNANIKKDMHTAKISDTKLDLKELDILKSKDAPICYTMMVQDSCSVKVDQLAFYFDIQYHSKKVKSPPSWDVVISKLREKGFKASRSHFGFRCIRTSANVKEVECTISSICS